MEENYLLAKQIVEEKYTSKDKYFYMYICALFGLFMKYPEYIDLIIKVFKDTKIIIEDIPILEIQKTYDLNLISDDELKVQDESVCTNYGVSDSGFEAFIEDGRVQMIKENPLIVCTSFTNSQANY